MPQKRKSASKRDAAPPARERLPEELAERLLAVWQRLGHLIEWCDSSQAWLQLFCSEARPYRETFYWEAIARMVSSYARRQPAASPEMALTDCLIATQCPPSPHDGEALAEFHAMWQEILNSSQEAIAAVQQSDLELARQEGTLETVSALYAAEPQPWHIG